ncbi:MAG: hypothetical protein KF782_34805 [Labilithrix sp.]|nr:hypothetical protein [Labilithrix sp.]
MIALCICGECLLDGAEFCSESCAKTVLQAQDQTKAIDALMTQLALVDELTDEIARLRREREIFMDLVMANSDYLAIAIDAGAALAMKDYRAAFALGAVAEVRARMIAAAVAGRRALGMSPTIPAPMRAA